MKFTSFPIALLLSISASSVSALKCGIKGVTKACIGDTDKRYDPDVSYDLKEGSMFWKSYEGLYEIDEYIYAADGVQVTESSLDDLPLPEGAGSFTQFPRKIYRNVTVDETRIYVHNYILQGNTAAGAPGLVLKEDSYYTATFEKDGTANLLGHGSTFQEFHTVNDPEHDGMNMNDMDMMRRKLAMEMDMDDESSHGAMSMFMPHSGSSLFSREEGMGRLIRESYLCVKSNCDAFSAVRETFDVSMEDPVLMSFSRMSFGNKVANAMDWKNKMDTTLAAFNIPATPVTDGVYAQPYFAAPADPSTVECASSKCPMEADWNTQDPNAAMMSPYMEPDGALEGGFLAGVSIAAIVVLAAIFYMIYKSRMAAREKKIKEVFAKSIAAHCGIEKDKELTSVELEKMFKSIDTDLSGLIDKDEFKNLIESSGIKFSDSDFDLLYKTVDVDGSGEVDFLEFCSFYASIPSSKAEQFEDA
ncbi:hypothetical protein CTEN210_00939 [Chaetoceros tenuissimus]|uniref:EF-hand domain-containing protein n=1 Tax=Chaetoceros tenuissimus TaxID=426638 RepID=A0AAD3GZ76_9STRA|nr:hypothetical protein CTEN210_00939 [Chaetoceros tenuissimus]